MNRKMKKNNKGFTLVEIIVVLLIIGILLAITIPSIMGYVGKAKDAQLEAEARSGYVAAQTLVAKKNATGTYATTGYIKAANVTEELGEAADVMGEDGTVTSSSRTIKLAGCKIDETSHNITKCAFVTKSNEKKGVVFLADTTAEEQTKVYDVKGNKVDDIEVE